MIKKKVTFSAFYRTGSAGVDTSASKNGLPPHTLGFENTICRVV